MASVAEASSLFEIDMELDGLLEEIQEQVESQGEASEDLVLRFQQFCEVHTDKVDRIGRFVRMMEAREQFCRSESSRLADRARAAASKVERTKNMVLYYLLSRDLKKIEGQQFTLRAQKNSQDSVRIIDEGVLPKCYCRIEARIPGVVWETIVAFLPAEFVRMIEYSIQETKPDAEAIKAAIARKEEVPGAQVHRGVHLRVACKAGENRAIPVHVFVELRLITPHLEPSRNLLSKPHLVCELGARRARGLGLEDWESGSDRFPTRRSLWFFVEPLETC